MKKDVLLIYDLNNNCSLVDTFVMAGEIERVAATDIYDKATGKFEHHLIIVGLRDETVEMFRY